MDGGETETRNSGERHGDMGDMPSLLGATHKHTQRVTHVV